VALTNDQLTAITRKYYLKRAVDNIFQADAFLAEMKKKEMNLDGGTSIMAPLAYATTSASDWYDGADVLNVTDNEQLTAADYQWKNIYANIAIKRTDELKNSGDAAVLNLLKTKVMLAEKTMRDKISTGLFSDGTTANSIIGLRRIVRINQTVGGIDQSTYSWWQSGNYDSTTTTLSLAAMQEVYNDCSIGNDTPNLLVSGRSNFNLFYALLQPQQRFVDQDKAKAGFTSLMFNGTPYVVDAHSPANHLYFLNTNYLKLCFHKKEKFRHTKFVEPWNQNVRLSKIYTMMAFGADNIRMQGALAAIAS
jgi:CRISPR/Cas system CSM-associated protein Csm2 small subunit